MHWKLSGMVTLMSKSWVLAWEKPLTPGTLFSTVRFCEMTPVFPVSIYQP